MKREYVTPVITAEEFSASQYCVGACLEATVQCAIPGRSATEQNDGTQAREDRNGMLHGICGADANITYKSDTGEGYEVINGVVQKNRPIWGVPGYDTTGTYTGTWYSSDGDGTYTHTGRIIVTKIDESRPNHS